jgi:integrase
MPKASSKKCYKSADGGYSEIATIISKTAWRGDPVIATDVMRCFASLDLSPATQEMYKYFLRDFFAWLARERPDVSPKQADTVIAFDWMNREHRHWSRSSRYNAAASLRKFYRWKYGGSHPMCGLKTKKSEPGPQRSLERDELLAVLAGIDTNTHRGIRDLAILTLMADTGMRSGEICSLTMSDLDLAHMRLTVTVKGGAVQEKLFFRYAAACLDDWLAIRNQIAAEGVRQVFVSIGGKQPGKRLTVSGLRYLTGHRANDAGIQSFSPHAMRRTFATLATENGAPTRVVQEAGGWSSIRMVERYTQRLRTEAIAPFSPVDRLMDIHETKEEIQARRDRESSN